MPSQRDEAENSAVPLLLRQNAATFRALTSPAPITVGIRSTLLTRGRWGDCSQGILTAALLCLAPTGISLEKGSGCNGPVRCICPCSVDKCTLPQDGSFVKPKFGEEKTVCKTRQNSKTREEIFLLMLMNQQVARAKPQHCPTVGEAFRLPFLLRNGTGNPSPTRQDELNTIQPNTQARNLTGCLPYS